MQDAGTLRRYLPFDICPEALLAAAGPLMDAYPGMHAHGVAGDFELHLDRIPARRRRGRRVVAFLGSTIGNLRPEQRAPFLRSVAELLGPDDILLLGTDLVGDRARLEAAYDDAEGITAAFNRNVLAVINRELGADFDLDRFQHVARWCPEPAWIEMRLRALTPHEVRLENLGLELSFAEGEDILTELSCKFTRESVTAMYDEAGLELREWHLDARGWYAVSVASRPGADLLA
jgi:L-histidine N-alpha-methyltransferase